MELRRSSSPGVTHCEWFWSRAEELGNKTKKSLKSGVYRLDTYRTSSNAYATENIIPVTLELGGKSPNIFMKSVGDADDDFFDKGLKEQ
jgi:hypothetical protein